MKGGVYALDCVGIDLPPDEGMQTLTDPLEAAHLAMIGGIVDYALMPDPRARLAELLQEEPDESTFPCVSRSDECNTLLSIVKDNADLYLMYKPTPLLEAAMQSLLSDTAECARMRQISIFASGWAWFMQHVYDTPSVFSDLEYVAIYGIPLLAGDWPTFIPVRASWLSFHYFDSYDPDDRDRWAEFVIESINHAECKKISTESRDNIDASRISNKYVETMAVSVTAFEADVPNLKVLDCYSSLCVFDGARYPKLQQIWVYSATLDEFVNILRTTPSLTSVPTAVELIDVTKEVYIGAIEEHAPHLVECAKMPRSYRWTPRLHGAFAPEFGALLAAYVLGMQRVSDVSSCAVFDPAAFEETIRHLRICDCIQVTY
jgi:hypothetical protein